MNNSGPIVELTQQAFASVNIRAKFKTIVFQRALKLASWHMIGVVLVVTMAARRINTFNNIQLTLELQVKRR